MCKITCPQCGDDLEEQLGYRSYEKSHTCSSCGTVLTRDNIFSDDWGIFVACPRCGENAYDSSFSSYTRCSECGAKLKKWSDNCYEVVDDDNDDDDDDDDDNYTTNTSSDESDDSIWDNGGWVVPFSIIVAIIFCLIFFK